MESAGGGPVNAGCRWRGIGMARQCRWRAGGRVAVAVAGRWWRGSGGASGRVGIAWQIFYGEHASYVLVSAFVTVCIFLCSVTFPWSALRDRLRGACSHGQCLCDRCIVCVWPWSVLERPFALCDRLVHSPDRLKVVSSMTYCPHHTAQHMTRCQDRNTLSLSRSISSFSTSHFALYLVSIVDTSPLLLHLFLVPLTSCGIKHISRLRDVTQLLFLEAADQRSRAPTRPLRRLSIYHASVLPRPTTARARSHSVRKSCLILSPMTAW